jgi:hypothetical protein
MLENEREHGERQLVLVERSRVLLPPLADQPPQIGAVPAIDDERGHRPSERVRELIRTMSGRSRHDRDDRWPSGGPCSHGA